MDSDFYVTNILPFYLKEIKRLFGDQWDKVIIQEDGATCHTSKKSGNRVNKNFPGGVLMRHPKKKLSNFLLARKFSRSQC